MSHSDVLAEGVVKLAREMGGEELALEPAGGTDEPGVLGTDAERIRAAIDRAMSEDGVLVLMDLGSALMSSELALELLAESPGQVRLSEAPLVEGALAAAVAARGGASLEQVAEEARGALRMKESQLGVEGSEWGGGSEASPDGAPDAEASLPIRNAIGLHARPAARLIEVVRSFDAAVSIAKEGAGGPVRATSLTDVISLGARLGDTVHLSASGPQASEAIAALQELAEAGFGEGVVDEGARGKPAPAGPQSAPARAEPAPAAPAASAPAGSAPTATPTPPDSGPLLAGVAASPGVAVGPARVLHGGSKPPPERAPEEPAAERQRLGRGIAAAREAISSDRQAVSARAGDAEADIFSAHLALLDDEAMLEPARSAIEAGATAERAWYDAAAAVAERYRALDQPLLRERAVDVLDVGRRVVGAIVGDGATGQDVEGIVIADELTPADAAALDPAKVLGIATARGSATAHAAILSRALGLPAVVGLGDTALAIEDGTRLLLDGDAGTIFLEPSDEQAADARRRREEGEQRRAAARRRAHEPGTTRDGRRIEVFANLGSTEDAYAAVEMGAEGVGLLRTEFLFLDRTELPGEEEQAATLRDIARVLDGRPLIVRTLDAGADKPLPALPMPPESNPFLGVRGIRLSLSRPEVLATQLRAILRVASEYELKAMLPMVSTLEELRAARAVLEQARAETGVDAPLELGIMVEVPAAALTASLLAEEADFFSLGTNDLAQYTMAAERGSERLAPLLSGPQPALLRLVRATVEAAAERGRPVGVCGELAGDPAAAVLLAGLGVGELSMAPALVPDVKAALRAVDYETAAARAEAALEAEDAVAARSLAAELL